ncbi:MAG: exosortase [Telmatospirillum sp.]|nr:exosortase [Telmatospirillum sp.]
MINGHGPRMNDSLTQYTGDAQSGWKSAMGGLGFLILLILGVYWGGVQSALYQWIHTGSYNHCFLILPVFFYLIRTNLPDLDGWRPMSAPWGVLITLIFAVLWSLAYLVGIAEGMQFAIVGMIQGVILTILGWRLYLRLLIPFSYLWLLVPSGEALIPPLQTLTARSAAWMLDLSGIPTFRDGISIEVPTGNYLVAPGCAGLNFILAALATSLAYVELVYRSWGRRIGFVAALLIVAVAGNAVRVFLIIAIAHLTNNVGDIVDDHLLYGWGFFSILLLAAMMMGQKFRQDGAPSPSTTSSPASLSPVAGMTAASRLPALRTAGVLSGAALLVLPVGLRLGAPPAAGTVPPSLAPLTCSGDWQTAIPTLPWPTEVRQLDVLRFVDCRQAGDAGPVPGVHFAIGLLERPVRDGKILGADRWITGSDHWERLSRTRISVPLASRRVPAIADLEILGPRKRLVWTMVWAGGDWRSSAVDTILSDLKAELSGHRRALLVVVATEIDDTPDAAADRLQAFLSTQALDALAHGKAH